MKVTIQGAKDKLTYRKVLVAVVFLGIGLAYGFTGGEVEIQFDNNNTVDATPVNNTANVTDSNVSLNDTAPYCPVNQTTVTNSSNDSCVAWTPVVPENKDSGVEFSEEEQEALEKTINTQTPGLGNDVDKILAEEIQNTGLENNSYTEILDDNEREFYENKLKALHLRDKYDEILGQGVEGGKKQDPHYLHEYLAGLVGASFITMGFLYDPVFFTFYVIGLFAIVSQSLEFDVFGDKKKLFRLIRNHPVWYILVGAVFLLMFTYAGYTIPEIDLSLTELIVSSILGV